MARWTFEHIPDQTGRTAIVTGATSGIGLETARILALKGANVVVACRNRDKGEAALESLRHAAPVESTSQLPLDLADLDSVATFAKRFADKHDRLDLLINNAGVMAPPLSRTKQSFELQFGTNHLGHFALTAQLWPLLTQTLGARVVTLSSLAAVGGRLAFDDLNVERRPYQALRAYGQSKLANLSFALELSRRIAAARSQVRSTAAHPGWTVSELQRHSRFGQLLTSAFGMKPGRGALPTLRAALDPAAISGSYWGPSGLLELRGLPEPARVPRLASDLAIAQRLWEASEELTGVAFDLPAATPLRKAG
jgi:NAD(P)-dependent dehydrogenase (short-subunit alcohol dehydrogenase family)